MLHSDAVSSFSVGEDIYQSRLLQLTMKAEDDSGHHLRVINKKRETFSKLP